MNFLKEPFLHFLLIGAALFMLYAWLNPGKIESHGQIIISSEQIKYFNTNFQRLWNRAPNKIEQQRLAEQFIDDEILYRQALFMGLDKNDNIIRKRLLQKIDFIVSDTELSPKTDNATLSQYLQSHPEKFWQDPVYSFEHVYINTDKNVEELQFKINAIQQQLMEKGRSEGDSSILPTSSINISAFTVDSLFGKGFSKKLDSLTLNIWSDKIQSNLGIHWFRLSKRKPGELPSLVDVRPAVEREWANEQRQQNKDTMLKRLRSQYQIVIEQPSFVTSKISSEM